MYTVFTAILNKINCATSFSHLYNVNCVRLSVKMERKEEKILTGPF